MVGWVVSTLEQNHGDLSSRSHRFFTHRRLTTHAHARTSLRNSLTVFFFFFFFLSPWLSNLTAVFARYQWKSAGRAAGRVLRVATRADVRHNVCMMISQSVMRIDALTADRFSRTIDDKNLPIKVQASAFLHPVTTKG